MSLRVALQMVPEPFAHFPRYTGFSPVVPVWCVTPDMSGVLHRFYDTSPFSPSGRYLALTRLPCEDRRPEPGDVAQVVVVDLESGEPRVVDETRGWDTQLGAQVQWGTRDSELYFNDLDPADWRPYGVVLDPLAGHRVRRLDGTVYSMSPDGRRAVSPCLQRMMRTQIGYGVRVPPKRIPANHGAADDDGVYLTDTTSGKCRLLVSWKQITERVQPSLKFGHPRSAGCYGFHVKWNPQGDRLLIVMRQVLGPAEPGRFRSIRKHVLTMRPDGSDVCQAVSADLWKRGGHHPNWCPDGKSIIMNLNVPGAVRRFPRTRNALTRILKNFGSVGRRVSGFDFRFVRVRYDGSRMQVMSPDACASGHPTLHVRGRYILTDAYLNEPPAFGDGTVPIRLVDTQTGWDQTLVRIGARPAFTGVRGELRVDPHPAWDRNFRYIAFNACPDGKRRVFVADLRGVLYESSNSRNGTAAAASFCSN